MSRDDLRREIASRPEPRAIAVALGLRNLRKQPGDGVIASCFDPAHKDGTPSLSITYGPDRTLRFRCFGCGVSGDFFTLVALVEGLSCDRDFPEVLRRAGELVGIRVDDGAPFEPRPARAVPPPVVEDLRVDLHPFVLPLGRLGLLDGRAEVAGVERYLGARGLLDACRAAGVFALPADGQRVLIDAFGLHAVERTGLLRYMRWTWPTHTLCIPWLGFDGRVTTLQRRHLDQRGTEKSPRYVTPRGHGPTAPFGAEALAGAPDDAPVVVTEGALDAIALRTIDPMSGRIALGVQGVKGWREEWDGRARNRRVWIGFDDDEEGDRAAVDLADRLRDAGAVDVRRLRPQGGKDWAAVVTRRALS